MNHENKYPNLIPNSERSPEELREMGRKGGIRSGESRRRKRDREKVAKILVEVIAENPEFKAKMAELVEFFGLK